MKLLAQNCENTLCELYSQFCARSLFPHLLVFHHRHPQRRLFKVVPSSRLKAWCKKQHKFSHIDSSLIFMSSALPLYVVRRNINWLLSGALVTGSTNKFLIWFNHFFFQHVFLLFLTVFSNKLYQKWVFLA